ncbi:MAG TPA: HAMP domain-containing sensor histidine kinase [Nevskiaceae bacterium]
MTLRSPEADGADAPGARTQRYRSGRLFWRLFVWFCFANVLTIAVTIAVTHHVMRELHRSDTNWSFIAQQAADLYASVPHPDEVTLKPWRDQLRERHISVGLLDAGGHALLAPPHWVLRYQGQLSAEPEVILHPRPGLTLAGVAVTGTGSEQWRFIGVQFTPTPTRLRWLPLAIEILVSLFVIGGVGWWVSRTIGRPVEAVRGAARRFARGELGARVGTPLAEKRDELGQLARDFDRMAARIQSLLERQRGVLQDVSHELRSPLTRLGLTLELARAEAGAAAQPSLDRAEHEIARLDGVIGEVLELSRMEVQLPGIRQERVDLTLLAAECTADARSGAEDPTLEWHSDAPEDVVVMGNPTLLARAIDNLLSNAVKFSPRGGHIGVAVGRTKDQAWVEVADDGPGVPPEELDSLFRPFFRGTNGARVSGHGLGLAIVARISMAHGGRATARNREGGGLVVRMELPLDAAGGAPA